MQIGATGRLYLSSGGIVTVGTDSVVGGTLSVSNGSTLSIAGNLNSTGYVAVLSGASLTVIDNLVSRNSFEDYVGAGTDCA